MHTPCGLPPGPGEVLPKTVIQSASWPCRAVGQESETGETVVAATNNDLAGHGITSRGRPVDRLVDEYAVPWACPGLTDIHHQARSAGADGPSWRLWERRSPRFAVRSDSEFKAEIVEACGPGDRSIGQVARDFDLTETTVREWGGAGRL